MNKRYLLIHLLLLNIPLIFAPSESSGSQKEKKKKSVTKSLEIFFKIKKKTKESIESESDLGSSSSNKSNLELENRILIKRAIEDCGIHIPNYARGEFEQIIINLSAEASLRNTNNLDSIISGLIKIGFYNDEANKLAKQLLGVEEPYRLVRVPYRMSGS